MEFFSHTNKIACIILSGGLSTRMNTHKALLRFSESRNFMEHIIEVYNEANIDQIIVVKNHEIVFSPMLKNRQKVIIVNNSHPEKGRLYSIRLGLSELKHAGYCFIQNIDNPFVTGSLLKELLDNKNSEGSIAPVNAHGGGHPVLISLPVMNKIRSIDNWELTLRDVLSDFSRNKLITGDERCTLNINDPGDYQKYFSQESLNTTA